MYYLLGISLEVVGVDISRHVAKTVPGRKLTRRYRVVHPSETAETAHLVAVVREQSVCLSPLRVQTV